MAEMKITNKQNSVDLTQESLFELQCIIKANDIQHAAKNEHRHKQFLAFVYGSSDLGLYYLKDSSSLPTIKRIPWFQSSQKKIACLCFDPQGSWLLIASADSSLYMVPAKTLVDEYYSTDQKWTTKDITSFSSFNPQNAYSRPTSLVWWEGVSFDGQTGIIGTEQGELIFINLEIGKQVGSTKIEGCVTSLFICQDTELGVVTLLITNQNNEQWHLILEKPGHGYIYPLINGESQKSVVPNDDADNDDSKTFPTARSRLRGLKQLSVEKLVILKQKLAETRNRNNLESLQTPRDNSNHENNSVAGSTDNKNANKLGLFSNWQTESVKCSITPVAIPNDSQITPQSMRNGRIIYTRYMPSYNHLTIHERSSDISPSHVHRMPEHCGNILLTNKFFYIVDTRKRFISVVSRPLSEIRKKDKNDFNRESIVARFSFDKSEEIINSIFTLSCSKDDSSSSSHENKAYNIAKDITDLKVHIPPVDACLLVTNFGIYKIVLRSNILTLFMDLILKRKAVDDASKLGIIFGLNVQQLIEYAGDIVLCNRQFGRAMELYSLAGCRLSKSILKFASVGYTSELLGCLVSYSTMPAVSELSESNRIHFSNLCILAFTELTLRATSSQNKTIHKDYLNFLALNTFYDELFAINIAVQTNMWNVLHHLVVCRGLGPQVLDVLVKVLPTFMSKNSNLIPHQNTHGLLMCLSDPNLIQGLLNNPCTAKNHICFVIANLSNFQLFILQRLITLYDPSNPSVRPLLTRFKARRRASRGSFSSQNDSLELSEDSDEASVLIEEIIEVFLQTLITVLHKKQPSDKFTLKYVPFTQLPEIEEEKREKSSSVDFKRRLLSTGFAHTALIRNGNVYTWGNSLQGCLGTGPSISRYSTPQGIGIFRRLNIEVLSVSCGRCHTLAVTNNGVYAWGSNKYGQIGLGELRESPNPELVTSLAQEIIVEAVAGQHHSVALTADGRLFTWGWGVHGQLGHNDTETKRQPTLVTALLGVVVRHASAGYAHTVVLSADGYVYAFGCNLYGQMGNGKENKCTLPIKVNLLPERITLISTKYFHNLAISCTNQLYIWGSNPQVLRLQSKERKVKLHKAKLAASEALDREFAAMNAELSEEQDADHEGSGSSKDAQPGESCSAKILKASAILEAEEEESLGHLVPDQVDTTLVRGKIVQISTGYHHSALLTKDGTIYTWGRNLDGQLGTGTNRDVLIPAPLSKQSAEKKVTESTTDNVTNSEVDSHVFQKAVKICCGSNFTVAIEQSGNVIAWGSNNLAQLGREPAAPKESEEKLVFKFKSSKRIIRCINPADRMMVIDMKPSQVPSIPAPIISYQTYDVTPLAGLIKPLSYIEHNLSDLTLHYALEQFHGLYGAQKIQTKCIELKYYQACAKLELLEHKFVEALSYQLKALKECDPRNLESFSNGLMFEKNLQDDDSHQKNNKLFEKQLERHLVDTLVETVEKQKMKMPASKSLDSFQILEQDLHTFDCQGGSEDLFEDSKCEDEAAETCLENDNNESKYSSSLSVENSTSQEEVDNENSSSSNYDRSNSHKSSLQTELTANNKILNHDEQVVLQHAIKIVDFYFCEVADDSYKSMERMSETAINFWVQNKFPIKELEKVFEKHMKKIYYSLGLLMFSKSEASNSSVTTEKSTCAKNFGKILSTDLSLKVCSLILEHIENGKPAAEFIEMLSISMANNYGPPLTGYPGTSENKTPEQMMEGIVSTLSSKYSDPRSFIHIKDPDKVSQLLTAEEDSMIFTCGHQFLMSNYHSEAIPQMEAELLSLQSPLPSTAQLLSSILCQSYKPETLCPLCLSQSLKDTVKNIANR